jgi:glycosyltransferase involved in cell wall biosynthesis
MFIQKKYNKSYHPLFSIIIPSWNNLAFLKCCIESIQKNSSFAHQIIVHANEGTDGTVEWLESENIDYTYSKENIGICFACNAAASLSEASYILYLNDDMYVCPEWDKTIFDEITAYGKTDFYFSATMIEPKASGNNSVISPFNFGTSPEDFKEKDLIDNLGELRTIKADWSGSTWPPSIMHKDYWNLIGGFSTEFSPGFYSDPDLSMKLWKAGVRNFKGLGRSLVYHFMSKSTGKLKVHNPGKTQFMSKWGIRPGFFLKKHLAIGQQYHGLLEDPAGIGQEKKLTKLKLLFS